MKIDLKCGDCLELMGGVRDKSIDAVITDPPYGIKENNLKNLSRQHKAQSIDYGDFEWDKSRVGKEYFDAMQRISKHQIVFGGNFYTDFLFPSSSWIVWDKLNSGDFADCEMAWTSHKRATRMFRYLWNGMIKQKPEQRFHPTQKPLDLMLWIVKNYTNKGDTILDPFMGSGTTGVACVNLNRNFIGFEINPNYFAIAERRINNALAKQGKADLIVSDTTKMSPLFSF